MNTTWAPPWTTTDVTKFISHKKPRALLTLLIFSLQKWQCHINLQRIWPALQPWNCPMPFKIQPPQRRSVTLAQRNFKHCANYQIFFSGPSIRNCTTCTPQWLKPPQNSGVLTHRSISQRYPPLQEPLFPSTPSRSPKLAQDQSQRLSPIQAPYPRVAPRMNPMDISSPGVTTTLPSTSIIPLTPHPAAENAPMCPKAWQV
jgi:hypothetical protein